MNSSFSDETGLDVPQHTIAVRRERRLHGGVVHEQIRISNHSSRPVRIRLEIRFRCSFDDIFVVKRFVAR